MNQVKIYDLEIPKETFERLKENIEIIDPSRNNSKKHYAKQAIILSDFMLNNEIQQANAELDEVQRKINNLSEVLK